MREREELILLIPLWLLVSQGELLADSREYVERLEEVRERLAGVGRGRKRVWREVRERCVESGELGEE